MATCFGLAIDDVGIASMLPCGVNVSAGDLDASGVIDVIHTKWKELSNFEGIVTK